MTRQRFFTLARTVHLYSSTALFASLAFFCITGFTLNHGWYLDSSSTSDSGEIVLPDALAGGLDPDAWDPDLDALQAFISERTALAEPENIQLDRTYGEVTLSYSAPAMDAEVIASPDVLYIDTQRGSWLAVLNDLHKNRDAGTAWSILVDITAIGMVLFALTGVVIVFQNRRRLASSLWVIALGLATPVMVFVLFVPGIPASL